MKKALFLAIAIVICGAAYMIADTTFSWSVPDQSGTLTYTGLALSGPVISGTVADTSTGTHSGAQTFSGTMTLASTALNVTNGQPVAVSAGSYVLNGIDGTNNATNTITINAPGAAGQLLFLVVATSSSNLVTIADSSPVAASGAILMDGNDSALLIGVDTNTWALVSESDN